jgi:hypothetical protein
LMNQSDTEVIYCHCTAGMEESGGGDCVFVLDGR